MKRRIVLMAWGLFALSLRGGEPAPINKENMQATGSTVSGVSFDGEFYPPLGSPKKLGVLVLGGSDGGVPSRRANSRSWLWPISRPSGHLDTWT